MNILEIQNLCGGYEKGADILHGIDLVIGMREAMGIIGLNGSGKSTLAKAIMNLLPYRSGSILVEGHTVEGKPTHELTEIAMMHQGGMVFPNLSVLQNLQLASGNSKHPPVIGRKGELMLDQNIKNIIPLLQRPKEKLARTMADKLSGGERHELALAMTLIPYPPKLVILDEPSAGLSPASVDSMYNMLWKLRDIYGISFLIIEQNISKAVAFCSRCLLIGQGKIQCEFSGDSLNVEKIESVLFN